MKTAEEILRKNIDDSQWYATVCDAKILKAMEEYKNQFVKQIDDTLQHNAAVYLEELHISGDTMVDMNHNICECNFEAEIKNIDGENCCTKCGGLAESGALYVHDVMTSFLMQFQKQTDDEHCPKCGCGFIAKYDDGKRICLYCPEKWNVATS